MVMRKIPSSMATQHADSASKFVPVSEEPSEAINALSREGTGLGCDEFMLDYMSKLTPYNQIGNIIRRLEKTGLIPGKDVFVTPRMVSSFYDEPFRQMMTILAVMEGIHYSNELYSEQGIIEVIHAVTSTVDELVKSHERLNSFLPILKKELKLLTKEEGLRLIPLFEGVPEHLSIKKTASMYLGNAKVKDYLRVFIGKSEAALLAGHPASVLSCKLAVADCYEVQEETGVEIYPILGGGALPFRGHFTAENADLFMEEYRGTRTYTIQSGVVYDHGPESVRSLVKKLSQSSGKNQLKYDEDQRKQMIRAAAIFTKNYLQELSEIVDDVLGIAQYVPDQRERILGYQDVTYYRELRNVKTLFDVCADAKVASEASRLDTEKLQRLPRPIKFTAAIYACGLPPEFLGTGNGIKEIKRELGEDWLEEFLKRIFPSLETDIRFASRFLMDSYLVTKKIRQGIDELRAYFEFNSQDRRHAILSNIMTGYARVSANSRNSTPKKFVIQLSQDETSEYLSGSVAGNISKLIIDSGKIRGSLG
jgi:phosphoenolpyruvate carboxylase